MKTLDDHQYKEFRLAQKHGIDPKIMENMDAYQMRESRLAAEAGLDLTYFTPDVSGNKMYAIRNLMLLNGEIDPEFVKAYDVDQLTQLQLGIEYGLDTDKYQYPYLSAVQMRNIRLQLLGEKIVAFIKVNAVGLYNRMLERLPIVTPHRNSDESNLVQYAAEVLNKMEDYGGKDLMDHTKKFDIADFVENQFEPAMNAVEKVIVEEDEPDETRKDIEGRTVLAENQAFLNFALVMIGKDDFRIIKDYEPYIPTDMLKPSQYEKYSDPKEAFHDYQSILVEAEKAEAEFNELLKHMNPLEKAAMDVYKEINNGTGLYDPKDENFLIQLIERNTDKIRQPFLNRIAIGSESPVVRKAVQKKLHQATKEENVAHEEQKAQPERKEQDVNALLKQATDVNISSTKLNTMAAKTDNPNVLAAIIQNPNCSTTLIRKYVDHEDASLSKIAQKVMESRSKMSMVTAEVASDLILKEFPSHIEDKNGKPVMLTVLRLPDDNPYGIGATCVVPSSAIHMDESGKFASVRLNPQRTFEIRLDQQSMGVISGKDLQQHLSSKAPKRSLNDRINKAQKVAETKKTGKEVPEKAQQKEVSTSKSER